MHRCVCECVCLHACTSFCLSLCACTWCDIGGTYFRVCGHNFSEEMVFELRAKALRHRQLAGWVLQHPSRHMHIQRHLPYTARWCPSLPAHGWSGKLAAISIEWPFSMARGGVEAEPAWMLRAASQSLSFSSPIPSRHCGQCPSPIHLPLSPLWPHSSLAPSGLGRSLSLSGTLGRQCCPPIYQP
jgi:hypothetical protein